MLNAERWDMIERVLTKVVLVSSGWAASPAAIDSGESRSRHGLYAFPSTGGGFIQMTMISSVLLLYRQVR
jgi:hypothetical protein